MTALDAFQVATLPNSQAFLAIHTGLPAKAFEGVAEVFGLTSEGLAQRQGISIRTIRDQRKRNVLLSSEKTEKLVRAARIYELARSIFSTLLPYRNGLHPLRRPLRGNVLLRC